MRSADELLEAQIEMKREWFTRILAAISRQEFGPLLLFQKGLYVQVLDALSAIVSPASKGNRDRLVDMLRRFSGWPHVDHVSLHHLVEVLTRNPDPDLEKVRKYSLERYKLWRSRMRIPVAEDPTLDEIRSRLPKGQADKPLLGTIGLATLTHGNLFYVYRNSLVHELMEPNASFTDEGIEPYYFNGQGAADNGLEAYSLVYPSGFLLKICQATIPSIFTYLRENRINPVRSLGAAFYWLKELQD